MKNHPLLLLLAALLLSALLSSPAARAQPASVYLPLVIHHGPPTTFATEIKPVPHSPTPAQLAPLHASYIRQNVLAWSMVEPVQGQRDWGAVAALEQSILEFARLGVRSILLVNSTPAWAQAIPGVSCGPVSQSALAAFASFMADAVARYSAPPYNVHHWEIWNEPDTPPSLDQPDREWGCWGDPDDAYYGGGYYAEMLKAVYPSIKAADPGAQVIVGGLLLDCDPRPASNYCALYNKDERPPKFLEGILLNGGAAYFDGVAFHGYDYFNQAAPALGFYVNLAWGTRWDTSGPVTLAKAGYLRGLLARYGVSGKYLLNTETALICGPEGEPPGSPGCESVDGSLFEQTKARYIAQVYAAAIKDDLTAASYYGLLGWRNSSLFYHDAALTPRPAFYAYQAARRQFQDAVFGSEITAYPGVRMYEFQPSAGGRLWVAWSLDGNPHPIELPALPDALVDFMGDPLPPAASLTITLDPVYILWKP
jgi:hypothetical protein